jgi:glycosyltransferase involved in cell wall biosynthesis
MRVLHINTERTWRGGEQQTLYLAGGLKDRGHQTTIACQPRSPLAVRARQQDVDMVELAMRGEGDVAAVYRLARIIRGRTFDVVHMHTSHAHTLGCLASWLARQGARIVTRRVAFPTKKHLASKMKYRHGVHKYIAVSAAIRQVMTGDGIQPERIAVVHSGIDVSRFDQQQDPSSIRTEFNLQPGRPILGNIGRLETVKGQAVLIDAMPTVLKAFPEALLLLVGGGEPKVALERKCRELGIESSVVFAGFRDDIPKLLQLFDVFVMPSLAEGLGTSVLDAMAAGVPVIASHVGGIPEIVENEKNGLLVPPRNPPALAAAIIRLLRNRSERASLAAAGRSTVEKKFTVNTMVEGNISVYEKVLESLREERTWS